MRLTMQFELHAYLDKKNKLSNLLLSMSELFKV